jgi:hypothetical protein
MDSCESEGIAYFDNCKNWDNINIFNRTVLLLGMYLYCSLWLFLGYFLIHNVMKIC